jgi:hypothetical protein
MGASSSNDAGGPRRRSRLPNGAYCCVISEDEPRRGRYASNHAAECWGSKAVTRTTTQKYNSGHPEKKAEFGRLEPELGSLKKQSHTLYPPLAVRDSTHDLLSQTSPRQVSSFEINRASIDSTTSEKSDIKIRGLPSWEREPEPLINWTVQEQRVLLFELKENPQARRQPDLLQTLFFKVQRTLPQKSMADIQECYRHLEVMRIAYFGTNTRRTSMGIYPKSPQQRSSRK